MLFGMISMNLGKILFALQKNVIETEFPCLEVMVVMVFRCHNI